METVTAEAVQDLVAEFRAQYDEEYAKVVQTTIADNKEEIARGNEVLYEAASSRASGCHDFAGAGQRNGTAPVGVKALTSVGSKPSVQLLYPVELPAVENVPQYIKWVAAHGNAPMTTTNWARLLYVRDAAGETVAPTEDDDDDDDDDDKGPGGLAWCRRDDAVLERVLTELGTRRAVVGHVAAVLGTTTDDCADRLDVLADDRIVASAPRLGAEGDPTSPGFHQYDDLSSCMDSFRKIYCRRCHVYDCRLHGCTQVLPPLPRHVGGWGGSDGSPPSPCGPLCVMHGAAVAAVSRAPWTTLEMDLLARGASMYGPSSACPTARLFCGQRTCAEVGAALGRRQPGASAAPAPGATVTTDGSAATTASRRVKSKGKKQRLSSTLRRRLGRCAEGAADPPQQYTPCGCGDRGCRDGGGCACADGVNFCEKFCACPASCPNRWLGCSCKSSQCRTKACPCFAIGRECDPDLCERCTGAAVAAAPLIGRPAMLARELEARGAITPAWAIAQARGDGGAGPAEDAEAAVAAAAAAAAGPGANDPDLALAVVAAAAASESCLNMRLRLQQHRLVRLGLSDVHGWGAFLVAPARKNDFLGEYRGEMLSQRNADRRGMTYDKVNSSFLFNLNSSWVLDAHFKGTKLKFANHSPHANCYAKVIMVSGDHRVGIFAKVAIPAGAELFYDYAYHPELAPVWALGGDAGGSGAGSRGALAKVPRRSVA